MKKNRAYTYDEQDGVFILEDELSVNWLLSQILQKPNIQITKITNDELKNFLLILSQSDLRMPDGKYCLFWLKDQIREKREMAESKLGETWAKTASRFRYIQEMIDQSLIGIENLKEKMTIRKEEEKPKRQLDVNNMKAHFEPLEKENEI